jgi:hypothetical protein
MDGICSLYEVYNQRPILEQFLLKTKILGRIHPGVNELKGIDLSANVCVFL